MNAAYEYFGVNRTQEAVLTVRLDRAEKRNALSRPVPTELGRVSEAYADDSTLKVAVLTAAGEKAFAAGGGLKDFDSVRSEADAEALFRLANEALGAIRRFPVPTVAALNGIAVGGGAELALACDFRVATPHVAIGFVHARLNITSGFGGGTDLMRLLGAGPALRHMLRAEALPATEARRLGLVDELAGSGESLDECVARFIKPIMGLPTHVVRALKAQAAAARSGAAAEQQERVERQGFARTWAHPDHWGAVARVFSSPGRSQEPDHDGSEQRR